MSDNKFTFCAGADVIQMGTNPEMADVDNPTGAVYGFASFVMAENSAGQRWAKHVTNEYYEDQALAPAKKLTDALTSRLEKLGRLPVDFADWAPSAPRYGSDAHDESAHFDQEERTHASSRRARP